MDPLYKLAVVLHVLAAITWIGGVLFMGMVAIPAARKLAPEHSRAVVGGVGRRFRPIGWGCLAILVITGTYMVWSWGATWTNLFDLSFFSLGPQYRALGYKLLAVFLMLCVSAYHDWRLGPRASAAEHGSPEAERMRKMAARLGRITGILVIVIAILAVFVARPWT
jgi:uncharacterized membrane protein